MPSGEEDRRLVDKLVELGFVTRDAIAAVRSGGSVVEALLRDGHVTPRRLDTARAAVDPSAPARRTAPDSPAAASTPERVRAAAVQPDKVIGKFVLVELLGSGGMGDVWEAWAGDLKRFVAIKFIRFPFEEDRLRFLREAEFVARLQHPNIIPVYELGEHDGQPYLVMRKVDGRTADRGTLDLKDAVAVVRDAALALHHAHEQGIVHRDVKPRNLMLENAGSGAGRAGPKVYVMDFGLARPVRVDTGITQTGTVVGTPQFMSPEQARGDQKLVDARSDVYGLGATLYALLTGSPPFTGDDMVKMYDRVVNEDPPPPRKLKSSIPWEVESIILKAMEKEPGRRYATAQGLAADLQRFLDGEPVLARRPSLTYKLRKKIAKHRWLVLTGAAALAALAAFGVYLAYEAGVAAAERERAVEDMACGDRAVEPEERLSYYERAARLLPEAARKAEEIRSRIARERAQREGAKTHFDQGIDRWRKLERLLALRARREEEVRAAAAEVRGCFERALEAFPEYGEAALEIARIHLELRDPEAAREWATRATLKTPTLATAYLTRALIDLERYEDLRHGSGGEVTPETAEAKLLESRIGEDLARFEKSVGAAKDLEFARGLVLFAKGDFEGAAGRLAEYLRAVPADWRAHDWCAHACWHANLSERAIEHATRALEHRPRLASAFQSRAASLAARRETGRAMEDFAAALEVNSRSWSARYNRALLKRDTGDLPGAAEDLTEALKLDSTVAAAFAARGGVYAMMRRFDDAVSDCGRAIELDPRLASAYLSRGVAAMLQGRADDALRDLTRAIELKPGLAEAHNNRGLLYQRRGMNAEALADYDRAAELGLSHPKLFYKRGAAQEAMGRAAEAAADYERAISLDPTYAPARAARGLLKLAAGDVNGSVSDLRAALENVREFKTGYVAPPHSEEKVREALRSAEGG